MPASIRALFPVVLALFTLPSLASAQAAELPGDGTTASDAGGSEEVVGETAVIVTPASVAIVSLPDAVPTATCIGAVYERARPAIVRVESGLSVGAGFVAIDASHVVTSLSLVADGHGVRVVDVEGNARSARVIVTAGDDDLALLELGSALPVEPLDVAAWDAIAVGREVVVATFSMGGTRRGRHGSGEFELGLTAGALNAVGERAVQVDASPAVVGGPIVDCTGHVVGVAGRRMMMLGDDPFTFGAGSNAVADLLSRVDHPEGHGGRVRLFMGLGLSLLWEDQPAIAEPDLLGGGYLQMGITVLDAFVLGARGHFMMGSNEPSGSDILRRDAQRFRIDAYAGWRQLVSFGNGFGFHFELALGASANMLRDSTRRATLDGAGGISFVDATSERWRVRPLAMATVELGWFVFSYQIELELEDRGRIDDGGGHAYHLFTIGFQN